MYSLLIQKQKERNSDSVGITEAYVKAYAQNLISKTSTGDI